MTRYIQFPTGASDGSTILVEVEMEEVTPPSGLVKAGIKDKLASTVALAQSTFATAIKNTIQHNVQAFIEAVHGLPEPPTEMEITFGRKTNYLELRFRRSTIKKL